METLTRERYLGLNDAGLIPCGKDLRQRGEPEAVEALEAMFAAARADGIELAIASSFRDFDRQFRIFDDKFNGRRTVLDRNEEPLVRYGLDARALTGAICYFSAVPGFSRHHFGTDFDIYSPSLLPPGQELQLTAREYDEGAYFAPLGHWLAAHLEEFGFYRPFVGITDVGFEPWHVSHRATVTRYLKAFSFSEAANLLRERGAPWTDYALQWQEQHPQMLAIPD